MGSRYCHLRIGEPTTGRLILAPHLDPLPRYSLRGGGEETRRQLLLRRSLDTRAKRLSFKIDW